MYVCVHDMDLMQSLRCDAPEPNLKATHPRSASLEDLGAHDESRCSATHACMSGSRKARKIYSASGEIRFSDRPVTSEEGFCEPSSVT